MRDRCPKRSNLLRARPHDWKGEDTTWLRSELHGTRVRRLTIGCTACGKRREIVTVVSARVQHPAAGEES